MAAAAIKYGTRYGDNKIFATATGTKFDKTYHVDIDKETGHKSLIADGKTNRYEKIQSYAEECKIENILARCAVDPYALNQRAGQYVDMVNAPKTLAEAQNIMIKIKNEFAGLSLEDRNKFGNSVEKYIAQYGTETWAKALGLIKEEAAEKTLAADTKKEEAKTE